MRMEAMDEDQVKSIFTKVVFWVVVTVSLTLVGLLVTTALLSARFSGRDTITSRISALLLDDARRAYEDGGAPRLDTFLKRLEDYSNAEFFLTDRRGTDLVTGEDRSAVGGRGPRARLPWLLRLWPRSGPFVRIRVSDDGLNTVWSTWCSLPSSSLFGIR